MKKLLVVFLLSVVSLPASLAHGQGFRNHYGYRGGCCYGGGWVGPAVIGGVIAYELSRPRPVYVEPPIIYTQPQVIVQQPIVQQPTVQSPPYGYHWQEMIDPATNQTKIVLVPN